MSTDGAISRNILGPDDGSIPLGPPEIAGFRIGESLGRGGMGHVYAATQENPAREVAIKILRHELSSEQSRDRFLREIGLLARIQHRSIVRIFEAGATEQGNPYYVMERVVGTPWAEALEKRPGIRERITLFLQVCDGVSFLHREGILHRDLKPGNLIVDTEGRVRILDFGLARTVAASQSDVTRPGQPLGTPQFMSPEQWRDSTRVDPRTDVYSLGVILYELLGGELGEELVTSADLWREDLSLRSRVAHDLSVDGELRAVVEGALAIDPEERTISPQALALDLRRYLTDRPVLARRTPPLRRAQFFCRRNSTALLEISLVLVVLLGSFGLATHRRQESEHRLQRTQSQVALVTTVCTYFLDEAEGHLHHSPEWRSGVTEVVRMLEAIPPDPAEPIALTQLRERAHALAATFRAVARHDDDTSPAAPILAHRAREERDPGAGAQQSEQQPRNERR